MTDNWQFTEEQRVEAYRGQSMQQLQRQTTALENLSRDLGVIRAIIIVWLILSVLGFIALVLAANSGRG